MSGQSFSSPCCAVCGFHVVVHGTFFVGGAPRRFCRVCAAIDGEMRQSCGWSQLGVCLHMWACEAEHLAEYMDLGALVLPDRYMSRLAWQLSRGAVRRSCWCDRCRGLVQHRDTVFFTDLFGLDDGETPGDELPLALLRSFADDVLVTHRDGSQWRAVDEIARRLAENKASTARGPLSDLAASAMPCGPPLRSQAEAWQADERSVLFWRCFARFGPGHLDGRFWVDRDGVCHRVPDE